MQKKITVEVFIKLMMFLGDAAATDAGDEWHVQVRSPAQVHGLPLTQLLTFPLFGR